ncbi:hypothetical protein ACTXT7_004609 [Hymenolepis weldensis]
MFVFEMFKVHPSKTLKCILKLEMEYYRQLIRFSHHQPNIVRYHQSSISRILGEIMEQQSYIGLRGRLKLISQLQKPDLIKNVSPIVIDSFEYAQCSHLILSSIFSIVVFRLRRKGLAALCADARAKKNRGSN